MNPPTYTLSWRRKEYVNKVKHAPWWDFFGRDVVTTEVLWTRTRIHGLSAEQAEIIQKASVCNFDLPLGNLLVRLMGPLVIDVQLEYENTRGKK